MTPRAFLKSYRFDDRMVTGEFFPSDPVQLESGDRVGVVLMNLGGPESIDDVRPFLYNLFMDPAIIDIPVRGVFRHWLCRAISSLRAKKVGKDYEIIGGGSPINRLTREQSASLQKMLNERLARDVDVEFRTYIAMRYWHPFSEETAEQMQRDGINKVVLLPLYPQYSKTTTGASLVYWHALEQAGEIPKWPTSYVFEYAANPKYVQAVVERIDEALQRFPKKERGNVHLLFSAHGTPLKEMKERRDPYCCLINSTVDQVMSRRGFDHPYHVAFQSKVGPAEWLTPSTPDKLEELAEEGVKSVLVVPIAFVTDHIETAFELDIEVREEALEAGIRHYEVSSGLNCHPLFIESLGEAVLAQVVLPEGAHANRSDYALKPIKALPLFKAANRCTRCHQCEHIIEARRWDGRAAVPGGKNAVGEHVR
ncbi:MAG: ferrochelatase [Bacteroidota bacterium]